WVWAEHSEIQMRVVPFYSRGIIARLKNSWWCRDHQGAINHITGDIHYVALALNKRRTILTIHDLNFLNHPRPVARWILKLFWITLPLKKVAWITVISEATKKDLLELVSFPKDRIKVVPNYYDSSLKFSPRNFN